MNTGDWEEGDISKLGNEFFEPGSEGVQKIVYGSECNEAAYVAERMRTGTIAVSYYEIDDALPNDTLARRFTLVMN